MNLDPLSDKLVAAARAHPPGETVPYAFEKRILALIRAQPRLDEWSLWSRALWRAAAPCVAISVLLAAWSWLAPSASSAGTDLSQDFENTVMAVADQDAPADAL
jgi:hypothetical protein